MSSSPQLPEDPQLHNLRPARYLQLYAPATPQNPSVHSCVPWHPALLLTILSILFLLLLCLSPSHLHSSPLHTLCTSHHTWTLHHALIGSLKCLLCPSPFPQILAQSPHQRSEGPLPSCSQHSSLSIEIVYFGHGYSDSTSYVSPLPSILHVHGMCLKQDINLLLHMRALRLNSLGPRLKGEETKNSLIGMGICLARLATKP